MNGLLVIASFAAASAQVVSYNGYAGLPYAGLAGYPYGAGVGYPYGAGVGYPYGYNAIKPVIKEIEVPVETIKFAPHVTGCSNSFGNPVPCVQEGEARKRRSADEEAAVEAAPAPVLPYGLPLGYAGLGYNALGYAGLGYNGLGYAGLGYNGLGYAGLGYAHAAPLAYAAPTVTEVEVPQYKYVPVEKTVELQPACQNAFGFAVPCA